MQQPIAPPMQVAPPQEMYQMQQAPNPYMYPQYQNPYMQNPYAQPNNIQPTQDQGMSVQMAEFPQFSQPTNTIVPANSNMNLLMGVQLEISVVMGRTKQKIKDIMDIGSGTVLELDKQTGSPAEIIVNGKLLAYGDIIVVGDNFGIRVNEIVGTRDIFESLK